MSLSGPNAPAVRAWIEATAGGRIARAERQPTVRESWALDVERAGGATAELFLRCDRGAGFGINAQYSLEREARVLRALAEAPLPVPRIRGFDRALGVILMDRVPGRADFARIADAAERERTALHFMECLAGLHALAPEKLAAAELRRPSTPQEHASLELDGTERLLAQLSARHEPLLGFALAWLRRNLPARAARTALVQGDTGPGNFLFASGRVTAIVDWEFAHFGDPMEDLAWICVRDVVTPFGDLRARFATYARLSGRPLDLELIRYYRVAACLRTVAALVVANQRLVPEADVAVLLAWEVLFARVTCAALADAMRAPQPETKLPEPLAPTPRTERFAVAAAQLRGLLDPADLDAYGAQRRAGALGLLEHLLLSERLGPAHDAQELEELAALLGRRPASLDLGLAALDAQVRGADASREREWLAYFTRRAARAQALFAPAMGELALGRLSAID